MIVAPLALALPLAPAPAASHPVGVPPSLAATQDPGEEEVVGTEPPPDDPTLDRDRILRLADTRVVRGRTCQRDGAWHVRLHREWVPVEGSVLSARVEDEVLSEARALRRGLGRDDHGRRAELARWMGEQGLFEEALIEIDRVLREDEDHQGARRAASTVRLPLGEDGPLHDSAALVRRLEALLLAGARGSRARREAAIAEIGRLGEYGLDLERLVATELMRPQHRRRAFGAHATRRLFPGGMREALASRAILDGFGEVREEAAKGLRDARDVAVIGPGLRALGSEHASVRAHAAESLGIMGYAAAVEPLVHHLARSVPAAAGGGPAGTRSNLFAGLQTAYVMDYDVEVAQGASIADPIVAVQASGVVFDVRSTVQISKVIELRAVMKSLRRLTGEKISDDAGAWLDWWGEHGHEWRPVDRARQASAGGDG